VDIVEIAAADTHELRHTVLRSGTPSTVVVFDGDDLPSTFHLGVRQDDDRIVAVSTWVLRPHRSTPDRDAFQLRGMATSADLRGTGLGGRLLEAGLVESASRGATVVWARARVSALKFYEARGFSTVGDAYVDETTDLPHIDIINFDIANTDIVKRGRPG
jgi:predicted GNAT family N-acyltransferase